MDGLKKSWVFHMPSRGLKLIGIRFYPCTGSGEDIQKAINIQKNLNGCNHWLYFNKGFTITEVEQGAPNEIKIDVETTAFDSSFLLYSDNMDVRVGFSAIIGQNGTGKSSIVDTVIRLVNNLSAAIIGEDYVYSSAQHLHYINYVYASLAVYIDTNIKIITCKGRELYMSIYETDASKAGSNVERYEYKDTISILNGKEPENELLPPKDELRYLLNDWFYTLVANYSLYAYNYRDYTSERTSDTKLEILKTKRPKDNKEEDAYWLKGVFHKNDGYQTPIVIHPMRNGGYVNAAQVNYLGKQNLISLAFVKGTSSLDPFPFRTINQTHHLVAFYFYPDDETEYKGFIDGIMKEKFDFDDEKKAIFCSVEKVIKDFWANAIDVNYNARERNICEQRAWDYVAYKTIKVFMNYKHYQNAWEDLMSENRKGAIIKHLEELENDSTHRTLKLRQALSFLKFQNEVDYYMRPGKVVDLDDIYAWMQKKIGSQLYIKKDNHPIEIDDLLPPPFPIADVVLQLVDDDHLNEYKAIKNKSRHIIPFTGLSAGERQIAYTLGNIVYHLKNIESAKRDFNINENHIQSFKYDYVNIMLDEVELYFHPDLQRRFVKLLLDAIRGLKLDNISGINVTLITHSPFVLSDIPADNILCLSRKKVDELEGKTFAANIHDLFNNTFFMPFTVGELARKEIMDIVNLYNEWRQQNKNPNGLNVSGKSLKKVIEPRWSRMKYIASIVGDDYLHEELIDMLDEMDCDLEKEGANEED